MMCCQMISNCDYENYSSIGKNMSTVILWWLNSPVMLPTKIDWCANESWCYSKWMLTKFVWYLICALMVFRVCQERKEHETQEGDVIQGI